VRCDKARVAHAREHKIQLLFRLKAKLEWHNERTRHPGEYETFRKCMGDLPTIHDMGLAYSFQGVDTLCVPFADLHDFAKAAFANDRRQFEIIDGKRVSLNDKSIAKMTRRNERATHAAWLEGNANKNFATATIEIIPLILSGHVVKVWGELDTSEEDVVAHVVISASFWLFLAQVCLQGYLGITRYVTEYRMSTFIIDSQKK